MAWNETLKKEANWGKVEPGKGWFKTGWFKGGWFSKRDAWAKVSKKEANWNKIEKEYISEGLSGDKISEICGKSKTTILRQMKKFNILCRSCGRAYGKVKSDVKLICPVNINSRKLLNFYCLRGNNYSPGVFKPGLSKKPFSLINL